MRVRNGPSRRGDESQRHALERWVMSCQSRRSRVERTRLIELTMALGECEASAACNRARRLKAIEELRRALNACTVRMHTNMETHSSKLRDIREHTAEYVEISRKKCLELSVRAECERTTLREIETSNAEIQREIDTLRHRVEVYELEKRLQAGRARLLTLRRARAAREIQAAFRRWICNGRKRPKKKKKFAKKSAKKSTKGAKAATALKSKTSSKSRAKTTKKPVLSKQLL